MDQDITKRLIAVDLAIVICACAFLIAAILLNQKGSADNFTSDVLERQRMLSQKIAKEAYALFAQDRRNFEELDGALIEFQEDMDRLRFGDELRGIKPMQGERTAARLGQITKEWFDYNASVRALLEAKTKIESAALQLNRQSVKMLALGDS
ncbi:MAG: type IV pili methyl-accepting chemotaxis transducer N-terminal domain-containing protein, partial [Helicobacteraceae bacterium]|nr:type IV pili methyl-accepting chemotaxis transducer N-terminal domain-containing protein [Helicobacteraceae bacterium]